MRYGISTTAWACVGRALCVSALAGTPVRVGAQAVDLAPVQVTANVPRVAFDSSTARISRIPGRLVGTVLKPRGVARPPVVLLVSAGGPTDRDGNQLGVPGRSDALRQLAESLAVQGIASLRFDKRGVGASKDARIPEAEVRYPYFAFDVSEWAGYLEQTGQFGPIFLVGHDEGALLAAMAGRSAPAVAYIGLTPSARRAEEVLREQAMRGQPADMAPVVDSIITALKAGRFAEHVPFSLTPVVPPALQPYLATWLQSNLSAELAGIDAPCLLVHGALDLEVGAAEADTLAKAQRGCLRATIANMGHTLKHAQLDDPDEQRAAYLDPSTPLAPGLVPTLVNFIQLITRKAPDRCGPDSLVALEQNRVLMDRPLTSPTPESPVIFDGEYLGRYASATIPTIRLDSIASTVLLKTNVARRFGPTAAKCGVLMLRTHEDIIADSVEALAAVWAAHAKVHAPQRVVVFALGDSSTPASLRTAVFQRELRRRGIPVIDRAAGSGDTLSISITGETSEPGLSGELRFVTRARWSVTSTNNGAPCRMRFDDKVTYMTVRTDGRWVATAFDPVSHDAARCEPLSPPE